MFVSPIKIWEMPTEWNRRIRNPRRKLRIGNTGYAGSGNPAINAPLGVIEGVVERNSIGVVKKGSA